MNNVLTIFRREMRSYFNSPVAYIVITLFLLVSQGLFWNDFFASGTADLRELFASTSFLLMFFVPAVAMRLLSEEKRSGTLEILVTLPVTDFDIVIGKFLAGFTLTSIMVLLTGVSYVSVAAVGHPDFGASLGGYIGLILMTGVYASIGLFGSSLSSNQIIALIVSIVMIFALYLVGYLLPFVPTFLVSFFEYISVSYHFTNIARGVIDSRDLIYYFSMIILFLTLAVKMTESRKWR